MREMKGIGRIFEEQARRAMGVQPFGGRTTPGSIRGQLGTAEHLMLPEETEDLTAMQTAAGAFYFMLDFSGLDGADEMQ